MNNINKTKYIKLLIVIVMAFLLLLGGNALAQMIVAATEPGGEAVAELPPSYISGDPMFENIVPPDENPTEAVTSPAATFSYFQVPGATLRGRSSSTEFLYDGVGCSHVTVGTGTNAILNTEASIPDGSVIKYLRVYYNDTNAASGVEGYITRYQPGVATADLIHTGSTDAFNGGYGFVVSAEITETVSNTSYAYTLIGWPDVANIANQICGLRIAYYAPFHGASYLPMVRK